MKAKTVTKGVSLLIAAVLLLTVTTSGVAAQSASTQQQFAQSADCENTSNDLLEGLNAVANLVTLHTVGDDCTVSGGMQNLIDPGNGGCGPLACPY